MGIFDFLSSTPSHTIDDIKNGSLIDVRSPHEFASGHHALAINIPLQEIESHLDQIKAMRTPVFLCCASGMRSGNAERYLQHHNVNAINLGGWKSVPK